MIGRGVSCSRPARGLLSGSGRARDGPSCGDVLVHRCFGGAPRSALPGGGRLGRPAFDDGRSGGGSLVGGGAYDLFRRGSLGGFPGGEGHGRRPTARRGRGTGLARCGREPVRIRVGPLDGSARATGDRRSERDDGAERGPRRGAGGAPVSSAGSECFDGSGVTRAGRGTTSAAAEPASDVGRVHGLSPAPPHAEPAACGGAVAWLADPPGASGGSGSQGGEAGSEQHRPRYAPTGRRQRPPCGRRQPDLPSPCQPRRRARTGLRSGVRAGGVAGAVIGSRGRGVRAAVSGVPPAGPLPGGRHPPLDLRLQPGRARFGGLR